jgi:hypothetical protein
MLGPQAISVFRHRGRVRIIDDVLRLYPFCLSIGRRLVSYTGRASSGLTRRGAQSDGCKWDFHPGCGQ